VFVVFEKVTVMKAANIYYEGKVQSRTILLADGSRKTLGVYLPGEYEFSSQEKEVVEMTRGEVEVLFPGDRGWSRVRAGESYTAEPGRVFKVRCREIAEYVCDYIAG
jgi:uncharacterized protein YaiE (UPF0345 family)